MTPKLDGLRAPGEKTLQELKDSSKQGSKLKILLIVWTTFSVNTYSLLGTNTQLNQRIFDLNTYIFFSFSFNIRHKNLYF